MLMACSEFCLRTMLPTEGSSQLLKMGHGGQAAAAWMASFGYNQGAVSLVAESSPFRHRPFDPCSATSSELARRFRSEAIFSPRVSTATEGSLSEDPVDIERKAPEPWRVADVTSDKEAAVRAMQCVDAMPHLTSYLSTPTHAHLMPVLRVRHMARPYGRGGAFRAAKGTQAHGLLLGPCEGDEFMKYDRRSPTAATSGLAVAAPVTVAAVAEPVSSPTAAASSPDI